MRLIRRPPVVAPEPMTLHRLRSLRDYQLFRRREAPLLALHQSGLDALVSGKSGEFEVDGYSYTAGRCVKFLVDFKYSWEAGRVNWRERVDCPVTGFNNRTRGTIHVLDLEMDLYPDSDIYLSEQVTPLYKYLKARFPRLIGSEFLGRGAERGACDERGVRNEDLTLLSFPSESLDAVVSLDVFEHLPDFEQAFRECVRVLRPGGRMLWSVPFDATDPANLIRAIHRDGGIEHLLPPEYHADSLSEQGVLCYQRFGWEMLGQVMQSGFRDAYAICYLSRAFGYLGGEQFLFVAQK